jgi:hypothetical protein
MTVYNPLPAMPSVSKQHFTLVAISSLLLLSIRAIASLNIRMLDGQTPNIQIIAYRRNHIDNKASVHANCQSKTQKHVTDLIHIMTERAWPSHTNVLGHYWANAVYDTKDQRQGNDIVEWKSRQSQMCHDHLSDRIGVDETSEEDKWDNMVVKNERVEFQIDGDEQPDEEEGYKTEKSSFGALAARTTSFKDVLGAGWLAKALHLLETYLEIVLNTSMTPP